MNVAFNLAFSEVGRNLRASRLCSKLGRRPDLGRFVPVWEAVVRILLQSSCVYAVGLGDPNRITEK